MSQSKQVKFILNEYIPALESRDLDSISKLLHKDYTYSAYPKSLGHPEKNKEETLALFADYFPFTTAHKITVLSVTDAPGKVILHLSSSSVTGGVESTQESITIDHIVTDSDGSLKLQKVEEFTDSAARASYVQSFAATKLAKK